MSATGQRAEHGSAREVLLVFLKLGLTAFGGPVAHLGYFRDELVVRRRWLDERDYAELLGLCQFLPGPASSQLGFALGLTRAGPLGGVAAWIGFTLPSALLMAGFALAAGSLSGSFEKPLVHGLKLAAVAIVAQALIGMARRLTPDLRRAAIALAAAAIMLWLARPAAQIALIGAGALAGLILCRGHEPSASDAPGWAPSRRAGALLLAAFGALLIALPLFASLGPDIALAAVFYRAGALVFGGGHVVLPLLRASLVPGWMTDDRFLAGYGAAQAVPGPLFTLAAYLGVAAMPHAAASGAVIAIVAIFAPGLMLIAGILPYRGTIARSRRAGAAVAGINASVVGLLGAALYDPVWISAVGSIRDAIVAGAALVALTLRVPPIGVVAGCVLVSLSLGG
ncbi:MAG: chromate efflux transporter [Sphingomonas sp.]|uniref:chromate efflux transporter n=1 Tax=Sphingomonas sp. TaxID=28214 RepID=UPI003F7E4B11